tara:strand:+ start:337 stop:726 length:390 start_codon:yes stop_codon:yes gene_type:complete
MGIKKQAFESAAVGTISTFAGLGLSSVLDGIMNLDLSNLLGLGFESVIDFFGQRAVFSPSKRSGSFRARRFIIAKCLSLMLTQILFMAAMTSIGKYVRKYPSGVQGVRIAMAAVAWIPHFFLRKYWVFR